MPAPTSPNASRSRGHGSNDDFTDRVRRSFHHLTEGDSTVLLHSLAPDVSWTVSGVAASWCGTWRGREEVIDQLLRPLARRMSAPYRLVTHEIIDAGPLVLVLATGQNLTTAGEPYENQYCFLVRPANDGTIGSILEYADTALMDRVLGQCTTRPAERAEAE